MFIKPDPRHILNYLRQPETFTSQVGMTMIANGMIVFCSILSGLLSARILSTEGRGEFAAIQSWALLFASLALMGMPEAVVYWGSRNPARLGIYLTSAGTLSVGFSVVIVSMGWLLLPILLSVQSPAVIYASRILLVGMVIVHILLSLPIHTLRIKGDWRTWNMLRVLPRLGWVAGLIIIPLVVVHPSAPHLNWLFIGAHLVVIVPALLIVHRSGIQPYRVESREFLPLLKFGIPSVLQVLPQTLNMQFDQMIMASFLEPRTLGLYAVAVLWSNAASPVLNSIAPVLFPRLSALHEIANQSRLIRRAMLLNTAANIFLVIVMLFITPIALPLLFGSDYSQAVPAALVLIFASAVINTNQTLVGALRGLGRPVQGLTAEIIGLVVTSLALAFLLKPAGIMGAAIASLLAYSATCAYLMFALWQAMVFRSTQS